MPEQPNVVLIHGAFADGSSWSTVVADLQAKGYRLTAPQFPLTSLADDVVRLRPRRGQHGHQGRPRRPGPPTRLHLRR
jgi:pimeloyl-ACP methyl ester carboxylesterase